METWTRNQQFAGLSAVIYLVAGVLGFLVTGFDDFASDTDEKLLFLGLNPMHNVVHLVLGVAWGIASRSHATARLANIALGADLLLAFVLGVAGALPFLNIDNAAEPDNYLHLIYGAASLYIGARVVDDVVSRRAAAAA